MPTRSLQLPESPLARDTLIVVLYLVGYVFLDWASYIHPIAPLPITPWNPPPGLSLFLLLRFGLRFWPWAILAALLADWLVRGAQVPWSLAALSGAITGLGYAGAAWLLLRLLKFQPNLVRQRDLNLLLGIVVLTTLPIALAFVALYVGAGQLPPDDYGHSVLIFWSGDVIGIVVTTPLLLACGPGHPRAGLPPRPPWEIALQILALAATLWLVFGWEATDAFKYFYWLFLPLVAIAMRHGLPGATLAILVIQLGLIRFVQTGEHARITVLELQMLMFALAITGLFLGIIVTARQHLETRLGQREAALNQALRLAGANEMTSALAHELNQPLSAIGSYTRATQMLLEQAPRDEALLKSTLEKTVQEVRRAGEVVHRLREFYRGGSARLENLEFETLLDEVEASLHKRLQQSGLKLTRRIREKLPPAPVDRIQIETVLHNLINNAIDSLSAHPDYPREIVVSARIHDRQWEITVEDRGPGISPELGQDIFDAFVSDKRDGLGLGLAISRSLVEAHGGRLGFDRQYSGARFILTLPLDARLDDCDNPR